MLPYYVFTVLSLLGTKLKIVASERTDPRRHSFYRKILSRLCLFRVNALVVQTESAKSYYPLRIQAKTTIIYNPLGDDFKNNYYKSSTGNINIVTMSRFVKEKNLQLLIHSFDNLKDNFNNITLTMYGNGPLKDELQNLVKHLNLQNRIFFPGHTSNVSRALSEADIYVCSSHYEGLPNSLIEAMSCGIPSVSTRVAGAVDLIEDGVNGLLVNIGDLNAMTTALIKLCNNDSLRDKMGKEASKIRELVNPHLIIKQWEQLLNKVLVCHKDD
jgi:glycosyltransferase involved in cell wall biosynthesis